MDEYRPKWLKVSAMIDEKSESALEGQLKLAGATFSHKEKHLDTVMGKEVAGMGYPAYYLIRYDKERKKTELIHLGSELGAEERDVQVASTDPYTAMDSLQGLGYREILQQEVEESVWHYKALEVRIEHIPDTPTFVEIGKRVESRHEEERVLKVVDEFYKSLGIPQESQFQGSVLQYMLQFISSQMQEEQLKAQQAQGMDVAKELDEPVDSIESIDQEQGNEPSGGPEEGDESNKPLF